MYVYLSLSLSGITGRHRSAARQCAKQTHNGVACSSSKSPYERTKEREREILTKSIINQRKSHSHRALQILK